MHLATAAKLAAATRAVRGHATDDRTITLVEEALAMAARHGAPEWAEIMAGR